MKNEIERELKKPFEADQVKWRVMRSGVTNEKPWAIVVPYIDSRAVQDRLDEVFGFGGWKNELQMVSPTGFLSGISVKINDEWITRWDGAEGNNTNGMDVIKAGASDALKRTAVLFGIGRYLYSLEETFAECAIAHSYQHPYGNVVKNAKSNVLIAYKTPSLPLMALPGFDICQYIDDIHTANTNDELEGAFKNARRAASLHNNKDMLDSAIAAGKKRRSELKEAAALHLREDTERVEKWALREAGAMDLVPNKTSVKSLYSALCHQVDAEIKDTLLDKQQFLTIFKDKYNGRLANLKQNGASK